MPAVRPETVTLPVPLAVVIDCGATVEGPVAVKVKVPSPPVVFFTISSAPCAVFAKVQVTVEPAPTVKLAGVPLVHEELTSVQPVGTISEMLNVPGVMLMKVVEAVPPVVDNVVEAGKPPPPVVVKLNVLSPPVAFFTRTIVPFFVLLNVHVIELPAATGMPDTVLLENVPPEVQLAEVRVQPVGTVSETEYVPESTANAPVAPVPLAVVMLCVEVVGPVIE